MTITLQAVNELIQSLESAGELSIKERKYLDLAKAYQQLAAENVALKTAHPQPFGQEMMKALDAYEKHQGDVPETGMLDVFFILRDSIRVETPATDRIVAGIKADGVEEFVSNTTHKVFDESDAVSALTYLSLANAYVKQLREGAK
ncbi:TPA: hypothetical protein ACQJXC_005972 [Raoultella ornithinolytica]